MSDVIVYKSDDTDAPQFVGTTATDLMNSIANVFKKCLVEGYGTKPAAGWTIVDEGNDPVGNPMLILKTDEVEGNGTHLAIGLYQDDYIQFQVAEQYTLDESVITYPVRGQTGRISQESYSGLGISNFNSGSNHHWILVATNRFFYLFTQSADGGFDDDFRYALCAGDYTKAPFAYTCFRNNSVTDFVVRSYWCEAVKVVQFPTAFYTSDKAVYYGKALGFPYSPQTQVAIQLKPGFYNPFGTLFASRFIGSPVYAICDFLGGDTAFFKMPGLVKPTDTASLLYSLFQADYSLVPDAHSYPGFSPSVSVDTTSASSMMRQIDVGGKSYVALWWEWGLISLDSEDWDGGLY